MQFNCSWPTFKIILHELETILISKCMGCLCQHIVLFSQQMMCFTFNLPLEWVIHIVNRAEGRRQTDKYSLISVISLSLRAPTLNHGHVTHDSDITMFLSGTPGNVFPVFDPSLRAVSCSRAALGDLWFVYPPIQPLMLSASCLLFSHIAYYSHLSQNAFHSKNQPISAAQ